MTAEKEWQYCAYCGSEVDTGWECNGCGADWLPYAYPWWIRLMDKIRAALAGNRSPRND